MSVNFNVKNLRGNKFAAVTATAGTDGVAKTTSRKKKYYTH